MKKQLSPAYQLFFEALYPYRRKRASVKPYRALLGIGGNIGDVRRRFRHLFVHLSREPFVEIIETAPILKNPPFGYLDQPDFYNTLIFVKTCLKPKALLRYILRVEKRFGRKRSFQDAPRTLDIDMIFYERVRLNTPRLCLPHHGWNDRDSVLIPLALMKDPYMKEKV